MGRRKYFAGLTAPLAVILASVGFAAAAPPAPKIAQSAMLGRSLGRDVFGDETRRIPFVSSVNGHGYSIDVSIPAAPPPPKGYPVIYVFDGDGYFQSVVGAVRMNGNAPNVVVVGLGYPHDPAWARGVLKRHQPLPKGMRDGNDFMTAGGLQREYDLALAADDETMSQMKISGLKVTAEDFGGLDGFLKTIEVDVKPRVAALTHVDKDDQALFGHSLGGLAVVEALFTEPGAYRTFIAASPSIWWAQRAVLKNEAGFDAAIAAGSAAPRVIITVGALEEAMPKLTGEYAGHEAEVKAMIAKSRMVSNACELASRLKALKGASGYEVADCAVFPEQSHGISVWPAIGRAVSFAFEK